MKITSINNDKIKNILKLKIKKYRDLEKKFLIEDEHLVNIALKLGLVKEIYCLNDIYEHANTYLVTEEIMKKISSQVSFSNVIAVCNYLESKSIEGNVLVLDNIQDPGNLGTIIRSAVAFNFPNIILGEGTVEIYNDKVVRSTEGMLFNINFIKANLEQELLQLKNLGYSIIGTDVKNGSQLKDVRNKKIALIIGNEGKGMNNNLKKSCDYLVNIPMNKKCESLNAAVSASILMYEVNNE